MFIYLSVLRHLILFFELRNIPIRNKFLETTLISIHVWSRTEFVPATSYPPPTLSVRAFLWGPLCLLLTPLGHQRLEFPPLLCLHMNSHHCRLMSPGSLALITQKPCQHQPHHWVPQNCPVCPETVWQPELSMSNTPPPSCTTRRVICRENRRRILILSHNMNKHWVFCGRSINQTDSPNVWKDSPGNCLSSSLGREPGHDDKSWSPSDGYTHVSGSWNGNPPASSPVQQVVCVTKHDIRVTIRIWRQHSVISQTV